MRAGRRRGRIALRLADGIADDEPLDGVRDPFERDDLATLGGLLPLLGGDALLRAFVIAAAREVFEPILLELLDGGDCLGRAGLVGEHGLGETPASGSIRRLGTHWYHHSALGSGAERSRRPSPSAARRYGIQRWGMPSEPIMSVKLTRCSSLRAMIRTRVGS